MKVMATKLVCNKHGGTLAVLQVSASQTTAQQSLASVVVHSVATLISRSRLNILRPLVTLLNSPGDIAVSS